MDKDFINIDTQEHVINDNLVQTKQTFTLLPETHEHLKKKLKEFDFQNPPVNPNEFASTLVETCKKYHGVGLSANQCGFDFRVFVMGSHQDEYVAFFNPKIVATSTETNHLIEGCLSFPLLGLRITRPSKLVLEYQDYTGERHVKNFTGVSARCVLHEMDHMDGVVFTERAKPLALSQSYKKRNKLQKKLGLVNVNKK